MANKTQKVLLRRSSIKNRMPSSAQGSGVELGELLLNNASGDATNFLTTLRANGKSGKTEDYIVWSDDVANEKKFATKEEVTDEITRAKGVEQTLSGSIETVKKSVYTKTESDDKYQPKGEYVSVSDFEDTEQVFATALNKLNESAGFSEDGSSTLEGGKSLSEAIIELQEDSLKKVAYGDAESTSSEITYDYDRFEISLKDGESVLSYCIEDRDAEGEKPYLTLDGKDIATQDYVKQFVSGGIKFRGIYTELPWDGTLRFSNGDGGDFDEWKEEHLQGFNEGDLIIIAPKHEEEYNEQYGGDPSVDPSKEYILTEYETDDAFNYHWELLGETTVVDKRITEETNRAKVAESALTANLNKEIERAKDAESALTVNINNIPIGKGGVDNSAILKGEYEVNGTDYYNKAISQVSTSFGAASTAGLKGWYYTKVNLSEKLIWLSDTRSTGILQIKISTTTSTTPDSTSFECGWEVGDEVTIVNDKKYDRCAKIEAINGNMIKLDKLPFDSETIVKSAASIGNYNEPDEFSITAIRISDTLKNRSLSSYDKGNVDFGGGAHAEGVQTYALNIGAHAEGIQTIAHGQYSHAEGFRTEAAYSAHAEGRETIASGARSHAEGQSTKATGSESHAEGRETIASGARSHAEGNGTVASGENSHAEGYQTNADGNYTHAEGEINFALGRSSHIEGRGQGTLDGKSIIDLKNNAEQYWDEAEFAGTNRLHIAAGQYSHVEGLNNFAGADCTHVEGQRNKATGASSHAEGWKTAATAARSHAEGQSTKATGSESHAEGRETIASGLQSHAEGRETIASGSYSHASGYKTIASGEAEFACGKYNKSNTNTLFSIGNGTSSASTYNVFEVKTDNTVFINGKNVSVDGHKHSASDITSGTFDAARIPTGITVSKANSSTTSVSATTAVSAKTAATAEKATKDGNGSVIASTYSKTGHTHDSFNEMVHFYDNIHLCGAKGFESDDSFEPTHGGSIYFGDSVHEDGTPYVYISEKADDSLTIYADGYIDLTTSWGSVTVNGENVSVDGHRHKASDITSGTFAVERIPTGITVSKANSATTSVSAKTAVSAASADKAKKLTGDTGNYHTPIYISDGVPKVISEMDYRKIIRREVSDNASIVNLPIIDAALSPLHSANRLQFANPSGITIEYSTDGGTTWLDYGLSYELKSKLISGFEIDGLLAGKAQSSKATANDKLRITINASNAGFYTMAKLLLINFSTNGSVNCKVDVETANKGSETVFNTWKSGLGVSGWSGWNSLPLNFAFGGGATQTTNMGALRLTFYSDGAGNYSTNSEHFRVLSLMLFGDTTWETPSTMAKTGHLYDYDISQNMILPNGLSVKNAISATSVYVGGKNVSVDGHKHSASDITSGTFDAARIPTGITVSKANSATTSVSAKTATNAASADKATKDGNGSVIASTYSKTGHTHDSFNEMVHFHDNIHLCGNRGYGSDDGEEIISYGGSIYFGDSVHEDGTPYVYISESSDDSLTIYADSEINLGANTVNLGSEVLVNGKKVVTEGSVVASARMATQILSYEDDTAKIWLVGKKSINDPVVNELYHTSWVYMEDGNLYAASDKTLKTHVDNIKGDLDAIKEIPKVHFHWNDDKSKKVQIGTYAQDLEKVYPELVSTDSEGMKAVAYDRLGIVALAGIDKLYDMVQELQKKNDELEKRIKELEEK